MSDSKGDLSRQLRAMNLSADEAAIYLELLQTPSTHLRLSRSTGIARTKVYRLAEQLEKRSLIGRRVDDRGTFLVAADPATLEVDLVTQEARLKAQRAVLNDLLPALTAIQHKDGKRFVVRTYEGEEGLKQMCWHELKTVGELLAIGDGPIERLIPNRRWYEKHRARTVEAGYRTRELVTADPGNFTDNKNFLRLYEWRRLPPSLPTPDNSLVIYNDTVAIYHWRDDQKVGVEIINASHARLMRQVFESCWEVAGQRGTCPMAAAAGLGQGA